MKAVVRAHVWLSELSSGQMASVEDLAVSAKVNPKVVRLGLRLAFLQPGVTAAILDGDVSFRLKQIPKLLPLSWREQHRSIG